MSPDPSETRAVYDRQAAAFDAARSRSLFEAAWLKAFTGDLAPGARVLDLGCGTGEPIARWLIDAGFRVTGVDFSAAMLGIARDRMPEGDWRVADMRTLDLGETFDGILAWGSLFHLTMDDQRRALPRILSHLAPGGEVMFTAAPTAGELSGRVGAEDVYHASLSAEEYTAILTENGLAPTAFVPNDETCGGATIYRARKP